MKCQILFNGKNKKNIINMSFAEFAHRVVQVNDTLILVGHFVSSPKEWQKKNRTSR